jgi:hypothetical protein
VRALELLGRKKERSEVDLWLNNEDLRSLPLIERKLRLRQLIRASRNRSLLYASHMERHGVRLFQAICQWDCEGIFGKYKRGTYTTAPISWVKILNPSYSQKRGRDEMFENFRERGAGAGSPA